MTMLDAGHGGIGMNTGRATSLVAGFVLVGSLGLGAPACGGGSGGNKPPPPSPRPDHHYCRHRQARDDPAGGRPRRCRPTRRCSTRRSTPRSIASGAILILDWNGHKYPRLTAAGMVEFVVGTGIEGDACEMPRVDGTCPLGASELNHMSDVAVDPAGRLVIAAWHNAKIKTADLAGDSVRRHLRQRHAQVRGRRRPVQGRDRHAAGVVRSRRRACSTTRPATCSSPTSRTR